MSGYIYVVLFKNGTVKVGMTRKLSSRVQSHITSARQLGIGVERLWVSIQVDNVMDVEKKFINVFSGKFKNISIEYFSGATLDDVRDAIKETNVFLIEALDIKTRKKSGMVMVDITVMECPSANDSHEDEVSIYEKIKIALERNSSLTLGVIKNRLRPIDGDKVEDAIKEMVKSGSIIETTDTHSRNRTSIYSYSLAI